MSVHQPSGIEGRSGATGWMYDLPKKNARPMPSSISAMPMAMSLTPLKRQIQPWKSTEPGAGECRGQDAGPGRAALIGDRVAGHGAEDQRAFKPEIDAARPLGQAFAQRHEQERRRNADRAAQHGDGNGPEADIDGLAHTCLQ